jgi:hypothetical protein
MKKNNITRLWIVFVLSGLSLAMVSAKAFAAKVGDCSGGGIVFSVDSTGEHGLIAATEDITTTYTDAFGAGTFVGSYRWSTGQYKIPNRVDFAEKRVSSTGTALGQGVTNTKKILAKYPGETYPNSAAAVATAYRGGGYSDWFLPSRDELNELFINRRVVGGFENNFYWSSSEISADHAWFQCFNDGRQCVTNKTHVNLVRPVRRF